MARKKPTQFKRLERAKNTAEHNDDLGTVRVYVRLIDRDTGKYIKGNITRTVTYQHCRVSDVADALEEALTVTDA